jgi:hypothetical protein
MSVNRRSSSALSGGSGYTITGSGISDAEGRLANEIVRADEV